MRLFGEPDPSGRGQTYHSRLYVFNAKIGQVWGSSRAGDNISYLIGCLPNYWMETLFGLSPGRMVAGMRRCSERS